MNAVSLVPIGYVRGGRVEVVDDDWGAVEATIEIDAAQFDADATASLEDFSHLVVVYHFDRVGEDEVQRGARRPRGNPDWPMVGILAQRAKGRPNRLGVSTCEIVAVEGLKVRVRGLDAIDGTPVLDIKPYMTGFEPRGEVREPAWARELMAGYW
jgi:tRNA-Thr(GGU) m(6)t(6)A37 methyltransferase TsaA